MSKRPRDIGRKYLSGSKKRAIAKAKKAKEEKEKGAMDKFIRSVNVESDNNEGNGSQEMTCREASGKPNLSSISSNDQQITSLCQNSPVETNMGDNDTSESSEEDSNPALHNSFAIKDDPATWPDRINQNVRDYLVNKGPPKIIVDDFPQNEKGLHFSKFQVFCKISLFLYFVFLNLPISSKKTITNFFYVDNAMNLKPLSMETGKSKIMTKGLNFCSSLETFHTCVRQNRL